MKIVDGPSVSQRDPGSKPLTFDAVPDDLKERDQWVLWRYEERNGRSTKNLCQCDGRQAKTNDPGTWAPFEDVAAAFATSGDRFAGIGYVFSSDDPFTGIDLDDCLESGELKPWAQRFVARFCDTYMEVSPSGCGIKIWCKAQLPGTGRKREHPDGAIEVYDRGRFFTVTGQAWRGAPAQVEEHQADVEHVYAWAKGTPSNGRKYDLKTFPKVTPKRAENDPSRHEFLKTQAARLRNLGMTFPELVTTLKSINLEHCDPPKPEKEIEDLARHFAGKDSRAERKIGGPQLVSVPEQRDPNWRDLLLLSANGTVRAILANAVAALKNDSAWDGVLAFNEFSVRVEAQKRPPFATSSKSPGEAWTDNDDRETAVWLQKEGIHVGTAIAGEAVQTVAMERRFHPVREYLNGLQWDGVPRLDSWVTLYLGAALEKKIAHTFGRCWLISAVARALEPGCKADCCLILEGPQGIGKSTALKILGAPWFTDQISDLGTKDAYMQVHGAWVIELAELDSISRSETSRIKAFMSATDDRFRLPYGKHVTAWPRDCVFAGSSNKDAYLRDETGGRRFWPIECGRIHLSELERDRDQLWAEAVVRYRAGHSWWLEDQATIEAAEREQKARYEIDPWAEKIEQTIADADRVTVAEILTRIGKPDGQWSRADQMRVSAYLKHIGWDRQRAQVGTERPWVYVRPQ